MNGRAFYNEHDPFAAQWLRNLIAAGHVAPGDVDARGIGELARIDDYTQAHFFAGIGVWSYALRLAGWPDSVPVWTGSCPCQPFSAAGRKRGFADERHLWPEWFRLIRKHRPAIVLGEQVASAGEWFDVVSRDLEGEGYAVGASVLGAHSVGAPHIRQRLYFVAHASGARAWRHTGTGALAQTEGHRERGEVGSDAGNAPLACGATGELGNPNDAGPQGRGIGGNGAHQCASRASGLDGFWADAEWIPCTDGRSRPVEPGTFPLAHGASSRVGRLRAYGNALNAETARCFVRAVMETL